MRRQILRASPAMLKRAAGLFAPLNKLPVLPIAERQADADQRQLELSQESQESQAINSKK